MSNPGPAAFSGVTIVTQTRVRPGGEGEFARWQNDIGDRAAAFPGFVKQTVMPAKPPAQIDWVILQLFASSDAAVAWLRSEERKGLVERIQPLLVGPDDIHIVRDSGTGVLPAPASVVISTRVKPGLEATYRKWEQRIAAAQARSPGFQGYRFEPPIPGVQDDWVAILRFDTQTHLQAWLDSPERQGLLKESEAFIDEVRARIVRTGFDQWFPVGPGTGPAPAAWKQNMIVLLLIYPIVFLFGLWVQTPILMKQVHLPFFAALFVGNVVSVLLLNWLVPWTSLRLGWWLSPAGDGKKATLAGAVLMIALYVLCLAVFSQL